MTTRNQVLDALLAQLAGPNNLFPTQGRKLQFWGDVTQFPALFLRSDKETWPGRPTGSQPVNTRTATAFIYAKDVGTTLAAEVLEDLFDAIVANMAPPPALPAQTLGGLVQHAWIQGESIKSPGELSGAAVGLIPLMILVP